MVEIKRCLDTYALVEIIKENPKFSPYLNIDFVVTDITLAEFYWVLLRDEGEDNAEYWFKKLEPYTVKVELDDLHMAIKFRFEHRKADISFFDAVGYIFSINHNLLFVTGDKEFENFPSVEFIKK